MSSSWLVGIHLIPLEVQFQTEKGTEIGAAHWKNRKQCGCLSVCGLQGMPECTEAAMAQILSS